MKEKNVFYFDDLTNEEKECVNKSGYFYKGRCGFINFSYTEPSCFSSCCGICLGAYPDKDTALKKGLFSFIEKDTCWEYDSLNKVFYKKLKLDFENKFYIDKLSDCESFFLHDMINYNCGYLFRTRLRGEEVVIFSPKEPLFSSDKRWYIDPDNKEWLALDNQQFDWIEFNTCWIFHKYEHYLIKIKKEKRNEDRNENRMVCK